MTMRVPLLVLCVAIVFTQARTNKQSLRDEQKDENLPAGEDEALAGHQGKKPCIPTLYTLPDGTVDYGCSVNNKYGLLVHENCYPGSKYCNRNRQIHTGPIGGGNGWNGNGYGWNGNGNGWNGNGGGWGWAGNNGYGLIPPPGWNGFTFAPPYDNQPPPNAGPNVYRSYQQQQRNLQQHDQNVQDEQNRWYGRRRKPASRISLLLKKLSH